MPLYEQPGPMTQWNPFNVGLIPNDVFGVAINWYINRCPLTTRLPKGPVGSPHFLITNDDYRPRQLTLTGAFASGADTTLTVADATVLDEGDVLLVESEYVLVTATPVTATTATVQRAYAGSTGAAHASAVTAYLITNTRTGAEVNIDAMSRIPAAVTQYCQTVQHAYSVGGALQADYNYMGGFTTPLQRDKMMAMQHVMDDFESACYYGPGVPLQAQFTRPAMKGLTGLIVTNKTTTPVNGSAYKSTDLMRDTIAKCTAAGGNPGLLVVSSDFQTGLATWGQPLVRLDAGASVFGVNIDLYEAPFLTGIRILVAPLLKQGTAFCLSANEVRIRMKRDMFDKPRGSRGDAEEGDIIMEGAIELDNEAHHAYVTGISGYAAG